MTHETRTQFFLNLKDYRVTEYKNSVKIKLIGPKLSQPIARPGSNKIKEFTKSSGRRFKAAYEERPEDFQTFITISFPESFEATKEQLNELWKKLAKKAKSQGESYLWVREATRRGRPHYHILFTGNDIAARIFVSAARYIVYNYLSPAERKKANLWMINVRNVKQIATDKRKLVAYVMKQIKYMTKMKSYEYDKNTGEIKEGFRYWGRNYTPKDSEISHGKYLNENDIEYIRYQIALAKFFPKTIYFENGELELNGDTVDHCNFPIPY